MIEIDLTDFENRTWIRKIRKDPKDLIGEK